MHYLFVTLILFGLELLYFKLANTYNIIDKPNLRSSHTSITLRGCGIIFPIVIIIAFLLGYVSRRKSTCKFFENKKKTTSDLTFSDGKDREMLGWKPEGVLERFKRVNTAIK